MSDFFDWIASAVGPLAKRVLSALGIGWITFESLSALVSQAREMVVTFWGQAGDVLAIAELAGVGTAIGIILGAIVARIAFVQLAKLGRIVT